MCGWRGAVSSGILVFLLLAGFAQAQDVAEAARQERARKAAQQKPQQHVYTEEDLKRAKILTSEDQSRVEARKKQQDAAPAEQNAQALPENTTPQQESLGEVARRFRREKAAREAEQAQKRNFTPFPYKLAEPSLAVPKMEVAPHNGSTPAVDLREEKTIGAVPAPRALASGSGGRTRVSPFRPRPLIAPPAIRIAPVNPPIAPTVGVAPVIPAAPALKTRAVPLDPVHVPEMAEFRTLQVQRGDSWWKLSERFLGSGARWEELRAINRQVGGRPELLKAGAVVRVPTQTTTRAGPPGSGIVVKQGDSLWSLARTHFGRGSAWVCLARANPEVTDYKRLAVATVLVVPAGEAADTCPADPGHDSRK